MTGVMAQSFPYEFIFGTVLSLNQVFGLDKIIACTKSIYQLIKSLPFKHLTPKSWTWFLKETLFMSLQVISKLRVSTQTTIGLLL